MHQHGRSVALRLPHLAMSDGGSGTDGIAFLSGDVGRSQANNQVFDQLRKISGALLVAKRNAGKLLARFDLRQPVFDDKGCALLQYSGHAFLWRWNRRFTTEQLIADEISKFLGLEWLHDNF